MAKAKPVCFGDYQFRTQNAAKEAIREKLTRYQFGDRLNEEDETFFSELFQLHSEYEEKIGCGIEYIKVEKDFHNNKYLHIYRVDTSDVDISWVHCIQPASKKSIVSYAFRRAVKAAVIEFKRNALKEAPTCPILNTPLNFDNSHVAYITPTFDELLLKFLEESGQSIDSIMLKDPNTEDRDQRGVINDLNLKEQWIQYHKLNAQLTLLSAKANLRRR
ncbi:MULTISPECIES: DCL family protein [Providencia]|uniref:DCL family protein n=1 Tax=Providencia TaxID=586 RepID=UPI002240B213|nr:DCL family protein [Providencia rustigianii]